MSVVTAFRKIIEVEVTEFLKQSRNLGGPVAVMAEMVDEVFKKEAIYIADCVTIEKPDEPTLNNLQEPIISVLRRIQEFREERRHDENFSNHLATIAESVVALSWITVPAAPAQFIKDMKEAGDYFGNRVLAANKRDSRHMLWINKWQSTLNVLEMYVRRFHITGFAWNTEQNAGGGRGPISIPSPPIPPPPPLTDPVASREPGRDVSNERQALMSEINQGIAITQRLKPVARGPAGDGSRIGPSVQPASYSSAVRAVAQSTHPAKCALEGRKWLVEYQKGNHGLELNPNHHSESIAMYKCEDVMLTTRSKVNGVTIDNCKKAVITLSNIIASVDLIRCERVTVRCMGTVPLISLDSCDSIQIALAENARGVEVIHSKSTTVNVCLLREDGDYDELPVPEQMKTVVVAGRLHTTAIEKV